MNVQETIKGLGNVSLKYLLHEKPQRLVNYRSYTLVSLVKGISRPPQCPSQMQAQIGSVSTSVTGALDASPKEHYCSLANTPWKWPSDPVYWVKHLGSLFGPVVLSSCQLKESELKLASLTPPWPLLCPLQTQLLCPAKFFPKYLLDALSSMCLLSSALSLTRLDSSQDLRPTLASPFHSYPVPIHLLPCSQGDLVTLYPPHITRNGCALLQDKHENPCSGWQGPSGSSASHITLFGLCHVSSCPETSIKLCLLL